MIVSRFMLAGVFSLQLCPSASLVHCSRGVSALTAGVSARTTAPSSPLCRHHPLESKRWAHTTARGGSPMAIDAALASPALDFLGAALKIGWRVLAALIAALVAARAVVLPAISVRVAPLLSGWLNRISSVAASLSSRADNWAQQAASQQALSEQARGQQAASARGQQAWSAIPLDVPVAPAPSAPQPLSASAVLSEAAIREAVAGLKVRQIKSELASLGVPHADAIEKSDLVERLVQLRLTGADQKAAPTAPPPPPPPPAAPPAAPPATPPPEVYTATEMEDAFSDFPSNLGVDPKDAMEQAERMLNDPEGAALMQEMQSNPRMMQVAMDLAMNGEAAAMKYQNDKEVMTLLEKLARFS